MSQDLKVVRRQKLRWRIRRKVHGTSLKPRLSVFRSNRDIYAQLINDDNGMTIVSCNSRQGEISAILGAKIIKSTEVGKTIARKAKELGITTCVFDRGGYLYHGRIKAVADGAREGGLIF